MIEARLDDPCSVLAAGFWTVAGVEPSLEEMTSRVTSLLWFPGERLTPWVLHDLPRIAWIVEYRAAELTAEERRIVRDAAVRMLRAVEAPA